MSIDWYLPLAGGGETGGLNDPGIESFKDPRHLARETVQNIIDAHDPDSSDVATVRFDILRMSVDQMPGIAMFRKIFEACHDRVGHGGRGAGSRAAKFMARGSAQLERGIQMPVLRIRDTNTLGLSGSDSDTGSRWYRLVRGQGDAQIEGAGGGTYGIGQRAPYAFSNIRTVFYSTMTPDGGCRFMGKFILCSCEHPIQRDGDTGGPLLSQKTGYFGELTGNKTSPVASIDQPSEIPEFFKRTQPGTDVFVMGFTVGDLRTAALRSVLIDFYAAILHDKIRVVVGMGAHDDVIVDSGNVVEMMDEELERSDLKGKEKKQLQMARNGLEALRTGTPIEKNIDRLGLVRLYVQRSGESLAPPSNKVSYMRTPRMRVQSKINNKLSDYDAVVLVDDPEGNDYLASLENPEHTIWNHNQAAHWTDEDQREAAAVLKSLRGFINESLNEIRGDSTAEAEDIPELSKFLPAEEEDYGAVIRGGNESDQHVDEETPREVLKRAPVPVAVVSAPARSKPSLPESGDGVGDDDGISGDRNGIGVREDEGTRQGDDVGGGIGVSGGDVPGGRTLTPRDIGFRSWRPSASRSGVYQIRLSPRHSISGSIILRARGETGLVGVDILSASDLDDGGKPLPITAGQLDPFDLHQDVPRNIEIVIDGEVDLALTMEAS